MNKSADSKIAGFGSRFAEKSKRENKVEFFNAKREKTKIKSEIRLIYDYKLKYNIIGRDIRRKTRVLTQNSARNDPIDFAIWKSSFGVQEVISPYSLHESLFQILLV